MTRSDCLCVALFLILYGSASELSAAAERVPLSVQQARTLFLFGEAPGLEVRFGDSLVPTGARQLACANCHERDGAGGGEGGRAAPPIQYEILTRENVRRNGYDARALARTLQTGIDIVGNNLDLAMPRYGLSELDAKSLLDALKEIDIEQRVGISTADIVIAVASLGKNDRFPKAVSAELTRIAPNGMFGRRLRVIEWQENSDPASLLALSKEAFILVGPRSVGQGIFTTAQRASFPVVSPRLPLLGAESPRDVRSIFPTQEAIASAIVDAARSCENPAYFSDDRTETEASETKRLLTSAQDKGTVLSRWTSDFAGAVDCLVVLNGPAEFVAETIPRTKYLRVITTLDNFYAARNLVEPQGKFTIIDTRSGPSGSFEILDIEKFAEASATVVLAALQKAGRDTTRAGFMRAFNDLVVSPNHWGTIKFGATNPSGVSAPRIIDIPAAGVFR